MDVDAVLFWVVWDAEKAALEVEDYRAAIIWAAQTALREVIGQMPLADHPTALHLRAVNMLFEGLKEKGALVIIPIQSGGRLWLSACQGYLVVRTSG